MLQLIVKWLIGFSVSFAALGYALSAVPLEQAAALLVKASPLSVLAAFGLVLIMTALRAWRWRLIVSWFGVVVSFRRSFDLVQLGNFITQCVPGTVSGDVVRVWAAPKMGCPLREASYAVVVDRAFGLLALAIVGIGAGSFFLEQVLSNAEWRLPGRSLVLGAVFILSFFMAIGVLIRFSHPIQSRVEKLKANLFYAFRVVWLQRQSFGILLVISILSHIIFCVMAGVLAYSLGVKDITFFALIAVLPPVMLLTMIPISLAGWGIREGAMMLALGFIGIPRDEAFAVSILVGVMTLVGSLHGAFVLRNLFRQSPRTGRKT